MSKGHTHSKFSIEWCLYTIIQLSSAFFFEIFASISSRWNNCMQMLSPKQRNTFTFISQHPVDICNKYAHTNLHERSAVSLFLLGLAILHFFIRFLGLKFELRERKICKDMHTLTKHGDLILVIENEPQFAMVCKVRNVHGSEIVTLQIFMACALWFSNWSTENYSYQGVSFVDWHTLWRIWL